MRTSGLSRGNGSPGGRHGRADSAVVGKQRRRTRRRVERARCPTKLIPLARRAGGAHGPSTQRASRFVRRARRGDAARPIRVALGARGGRRRLCVRILPAVRIPGIVFAHKVEPVMLLASDLVPKWAVFGAGTYCVAAPDVSALGPHR